MLSAATLILKQATKVPSRNDRDIIAMFSITFHFNSGTPPQLKNTSLVKL